jgi:MazG family protein
MPENSSRPPGAASSAPLGSTDAFNRLLEIMARLRSSDGCPWDLSQDLDSLRPYLLEETYEVLEALDAGDLGELRAELGDLLFQIVFQARIAEERGAFSMTDVLTGIADKLVRRHPHVFAGERPGSGPDLGRRWADLKRAERIEQGTAQPSALDGVPAGAPALLRAERLGEKAASEGFDWPDLAGVRDKLREELLELDAAIAGGQQREIRAELGDVLFTLCNLARWLETPAEDALREALGRFGRRFRHVEALLAQDGKRIRDVDPAETDRLWQEAKRRKLSGDD